ncbi:flavin reductase family protein [Streptosporangiaceae bacterium NEAU-GS5]|nr:flavin reductase family protein [Streptosporangiaceae bacterium NEAU-GS5]
MTIDVGGGLGQVTDTKTLRRVFGTFATGVTVVTTGGEAPHAMTANAFTSVSLDPPLLLICVDHSAVMHESVTRAGRFAVSVLASHQEDVARHFADKWRTLGAAQFECVSWSPGPHSGAPLIDGSVAQFECELWRAYEAGDHTIFVGRVLALTERADDPPLVFHRGAFGALTEKALTESVLTKSARPERDANGRARPEGSH